MSHAVVLPLSCTPIDRLYFYTATLARARSTTAQQDPIASLFTSTEDALLLQLLKEGHSPVEIERRWGELSRRIASSSGSGGGGAAGRATKRKEKGAIEERASRWVGPVSAVGEDELTSQVRYSIEQENYATLHRGSRTFFLPPIVSHDLFNHPPQSRASSAIPPLTANALDDEAPQASSSSSLSSFSLSPPCPRPHPHPRPPTALPFAEPKTLPRPQRTPFSLTRHVISSPPLTSVEGEETLPRQKQFTALELLAQVAESPKKGRSESRGGVVKCLLVGGEDEEGGEVEGRENGDGGVMRGLLFVSPKKRKAGRRGGEQAPREGRKRAKA